MKLPWKQIAEHSGRIARRMKGMAAIRIKKDCVLRGYVNAS
jgi:hypothetical protein